MDQYSYINTASMKIKNVTGFAKSNPIHTRTKIQFEA